MTVPTENGTARLLDLLAQARKFVPSLTRLAGEIDVQLGLAGEPSAQPDSLVRESYGRGHGWFRPELGETYARWRGQS